MNVSPVMSWKHCDVFTHC